MLIKPKVKKITIIINNITVRIINAFFSIGFDIKSNIINVKNTVWNKETQESNLKPEFNIKRNPKINKDRVIPLIAFFMTPF